jgi:hypothetical protein
MRAQILRRRAHRLRPVLRQAPGRQLKLSSPAMYGPVKRLPLFIEFKPFEANRSKGLFINPYASGAFRCR